MERLEVPEFIKPRNEISAASELFLEAIQAVIKEHESYWPLSLRTIHYRLLSLKVVRNTRTRSLQEGLHELPRARRR
jgi:hypothetical protein